MGCPFNRQIHFVFSGIFQRTAGFFRVFPFTCPQPSFGFPLNPPKMGQPDEPSRSEAPAGCQGYQLARDRSWRSLFRTTRDPQNGSCVCGFPLTLPRKDALQNHRTKLGHLTFLTCFWCPFRTIHNKCPPFLVVLRREPRGSHPLRGLYGNPREITIFLQEKPRSHLFCTYLCRHPHHGLRSWTGVRKVVSFPRKAHRTLNPPCTLLVSPRKSGARQLECNSRSCYTHVRLAEVCSRPPRVPFSVGWGALNQPKQRSMVLSVFLWDDFP